MAGAVMAAALALHCSSSSIAPRQVSRSNAGAYEAALAAIGDGFVASWYDERDDNGEIYVRRIESDGQPRGNELRLTHDVEESYEPSVAAVADDRLALAWYDKAGDGSLTARIGVWTVDGVPVWTSVLPGPGRNPVVSVDRGAIVVAWIRRSPEGVDTEQVWAARWSETGEAIGAPLPLGVAHQTTWNVNLDIGSDGVAWVAWDAVWNTRASELFLARVASDDVSVARLTADDGHESKYPDIALNGDAAAVTWFDAKDGNTEVYLFTATPRDLTAEIGTLAKRVTSTSGESIGAYLAWNSGRLGLAWCDDTVGQHEIYFQAFDRDGRASAAPLRVTRSSTSSLVPAIEPWRDAFALAWTEFAPSGRGHEGRSEIAFALVR